METRYCPLLEKQIDDGTCFDIHMVVEGLAPDRTAPEKAVNHPRRDEVCLKCEHHDMD